MGGRGDAGASSKDDLGGHELAVVLAEGSWEGVVAGVSGVATGGPLPELSEELLEAGGVGSGSGVEVVGVEVAGGSGGRQVMAGGVLPLKLGGEAMAGVGEGRPAGEGIGLEEAEVADGGFGEVVERLEAVEGVDGPAGLGGGVVVPVERSLPALVAEGDPTFGEPEFGAGVAAIVEEGEVLSAGNEASTEGERLEEDLVAGGLVVEGEGGVVGGVGGDADGDESAGEADPFLRWGERGAGGRCRRSEESGVERIGEEGVLDVGGDEFEVLLLVLEAKDDAASGFVFERVLEERSDGGVDVGAVGEDGLERRAREGSAEFFFRHITERVVVAVEEPEEVGMEGLVAGEELTEDEGLKEPTGVGEVPFDGAGLGAGLDHEIFG